MYLVHDDASQVWSGDLLVFGLMHYSYLEIEVVLSASGLLDISIAPV